MADKKISALTLATTPLAGTEVLPIVQSGATVKVPVSDLTAGRSISVGGLTNTGVTASSMAFFNASQLLSGNAALTWNAGTQQMGFQNAAANAYAYIGTSGAGTNADWSVYMGATETTRFGNAGDLTLKTGNLVIGTSGKGIDFSATGQAAGMTSELLADYEEGTWAAVLSDGTNTVNLGNGTYTKIGRSVFLILDAYSKSMAGLNTAANLTITGIPFVPVNGSINAWIPSLNVALTSFAINCASNGIIYPIRTNNAVDFNLTPLSVFGSPGTMSWQFTANYSV